MDGRTDGQKDGWMDGWIDGWIRGGWREIVCANLVVHYTIIFMLKFSHADGEVRTGGGVQREG